MKKFIRIVIKSGLIFFVLILVGVIKLFAEAAMQTTTLGVLELAILYAGTWAAIRAIYKYKGKGASDNTEPSLNKDTE